MEAVVVLGRIRVVIVVYVHVHLVMLGLICQQVLIWLMHQQNVLHKGHVIVSMVNVYVVQGL